MFRQLRFQHVFVCLMLLAGLSAFVIPRQYTDKAAPQVQSVFWPVSEPVRAVAGRAHRVMGLDAQRDRRTVNNVRLENERLKNELVYVQTQYERAQQKLKMIGSFGPLADRCVPVSVVGGDPGTRESLLIHGAAPEGVAPGKYALHLGGVVGRIERAGMAGGQIRLVTDRGFRIEAGFKGIRRTQGGRTEAVPIATPVVLVEGVGDNTMRIPRGLTMQDVKNADLQPGDWAIVQDREWPEPLWGQRIAEVVKIAPRADAPLFAEVTLRPTTNLQLLSEVMVVVR